MAIKEGGVRTGPSHRVAREKNSEKKKELEKEGTKVGLKEE